MSDLNKFFLLVCWLHGNLLVAQYSTGALRPIEELRAAEAETRQQRNPLPKSLFPLAEVLPEKVSLRSYCPTAGNQRHQPSCVAWATVHSALTTQLAKKWNILEQRRIDALAFSVSHVFNQVSAICKPISLPELRPVLSSGVMFAAFAPNEWHCNTLPKLRNPFYLTNFEALLLQEDPFDKHLLWIKRELAQGFPVVIQVRSVLSLYHPENGIWNPNPEAPDTDTDHVLCIVGYDDKSKTFELLNSWGEQWGDKGFTRVRYETLLDKALDYKNGILIAAYKVHLNFDINLLPYVGVQPLLQRLKAHSSQMEAQYETISVENGSDLQILKQSFSKKEVMRLLLPVLHSQTYIYVFGRDAATKRWIVYAKRPTTPHEIGILLPNDTDVFNFPSAGTEIIQCALSSEDISIAVLQEKLNQLSQTVPTDLHEAIKLFFKEVFLTTFVLEISS